MIGTRGPFTSATMTASEGVPGTRQATTGPDAAARHYGAAIGKRGLMWVKVGVLGLSHSSLSALDPVHEPIRALSECVRATFNRMRSL